MIEKLEGILISSVDYSESSKILNIFTKEHGLIGVIAKGARRIKSQIRSVSEKFTYGYINLYYKKDRLSILISIDVINPLKNIKKDLLLLSYINYILELTSQVAKQSIYISSIYNMCISSILKIEDAFDPKIITNILEIKYLEYLGIELNLNECVLCGSKEVVTLSVKHGGFVCPNCIDGEYIVNKKTIKIIQMLKYLDISKISKLDISEEVKNEINSFINNYYLEYTGLYLKSKDFLDKIS